MEFYLLDQNKDIYQQPYKTYIHQDYTYQLHMNNFILLKFQELYLIYY